MFRKYFIAVLILAGLAGTLSATKVLQIKTLIAAGKSFAPPPESVSTAIAEKQQWQGTLSAIASVAAVQGVIVTPDIPGTVKEIAFESGALVGKDAVLVRLDTSAEEAQLKAVLAQVDLAKVSLVRVRSLREQQMIQHVRQLLDDERLRVDTSRGRRPVVGLRREVNHTNRAVELKRTMSELGIPDRDGF